MRIVFVCPSAQSNFCYGSFHSTFMFINSDDKLIWIISALIGQLRTFKNNQGEFRTKVRSAQVVSILVLFKIHRGTDGSSRFTGLQSPLQLEQETWTPGDVRTLSPLRLPCFFFPSVYQFSPCSILHCFGFKEPWVDLHMNERVVFNYDLRCTPLAEERRDTWHKADQPN